MDSSSKFVENYDSLWFFNNVLTLSTFQQEPDIVKEEEQFKPNAQILEIDSGNLIPRWCPKCGEIEEPVKEIEIEKPTEREQRRRRKRKAKRKILGELDLGFHGDHLAEETQQYYDKMPPLNDGMAMKEHLKSWAYAVACRVR